jgi:outer membrane receptor protein involved in Fe transport
VSCPASRCNGSWAANTSRSRSTPPRPRTFQTALAADTRIERTFSQETEGFGTQVLLGLPRRRDVEGGARWNYEHKDFKIFRQTFLGDGTLGFSPNSADQGKTWQTPTGNLILTYHFNQQMSAFAKYSRGFKAGHFNALASENVNRPPAKPEYNDAWEAGLAGSWLDQRLSGSVNYFYYKYQDYQVFLFRSVADEPPVLEVINANKAENYGVEVEARARSCAADLALDGEPAAHRERRLAARRVPDLRWHHAAARQEVFRRSTWATSSPTRPSSNSPAPRPGRSTSGAGATSSRATTSAGPTTSRLA